MFLEWLPKRVSWRSRTWAVEEASVAAAALVVVAGLAEAVVPVVGLVEGLAMAEVLVVGLEAVKEAV